MRLSVSTDPFNVDRQAGKFLVDLFLAIEYLILVCQLTNWDFRNALRRKSLCFSREKLRIRKQVKPLKVKT